VSEATWLGKKRGVTAEKDPAGVVHEATVEGPAHKGVEHEDAMDVFEEVYGYGRGGLGGLGGLGGGG
jgi:hypothetical protein